VMMQFVTGQRPAALSVPRPAVARMGGKATVWILKDSRVEHRDVTAGLESPERIEITSGLQAGEVVVVGSHDALYAGARVTPVGGPSPLPDQSGASPPGEMKGMEGTTGPGAPPAKPKEGGHGAGH